MRWFRVEGLILAAMSDDGSEAYGWDRGSKSWRSIMPGEILGDVRSPEINFSEATISAKVMGADLGSLPIKSEKASGKADIVSP